MAATSSALFSTTRDQVISLCAVSMDDTTRLRRFVETATQQLSIACPCYEILLIDNAASQAVEETLTELQQELPGIRVLRLSRRCHPEIAYTAALDHCIGDFVVLLNMETDPPELALRLVQRLQESGRDLVMAQPRGGAVRKLSWRLRVVYGLAKRLLHHEFEQGFGHCCGLSRRLVNSMTKVRHRSRHFTYLGRLVGYRHDTIAYQPLEAPVRAISVWREFFDVVDLVIAHSAAPLRLASLLGLLASLLNLAYLGYILAVVVIKRNLAEGWLTTSLTSTGMFFLLFLIMTVLTEYIARILEESKQQPLYFVEYEASSSASTLDRQRLNVVGS